MGRETLTVTEMREMLTAEAVISAYKSRKASKNWVEWAREHPELNDLLMRAERMRADE